MSNLTDYLDWRGDLSFDDAPMNEVDALVFAWLAYYEFEKLEAEIAGRTLREIAALHEARFGEFRKPRLRDAPGTPIPSAIWMLHCASQTRRFGTLCLPDFYAQNEAGVQFGAVTFRIPGRRVVAFRGTDSSLTGWREDFELSFSEEVSAQRLALDYLNRTGGEEPLVLCGHSKGGNIAVYAAVNTSSAQRARVEKIWNFDGPGFCYPIQNREGYREITDRMEKIVPESSIIGMLLTDRSEPFRIVDSKMRGVFQHNGMFWQILGTRFVEVDRRSASSVLIDDTLARWIDDMPLEERKKFIEVIFTVIESTGIRDFSELDDHALLAGRRMLSGVRTLTREQKSMALHLLLRLLKACRQVIVDGYEAEE